MLETVITENGIYSSDEEYEYKDLSQKAKKKAYKDTLKFYDYAIKDMLENTIFNKNGKRVRCVAMKDILI